MRYSFFISIFLIFLLSACATSTVYQEQLKKWQGKSSQSLKQSWGKPDIAIKLANGNILYQYILKKYSTVKDPKHSLLHNNSLFLSYKQPWLNNRTCVHYYCTTFEINNRGLIVGTHLKSNRYLENHFIR